MNSPSTSVRAATNARSMPKSACARQSRINTIWSPASNDHTHLHVFGTALVKARVCSKARARSLVKELIARYRPDGFFFDTMSAFGVCYCEACRAAFQSGEFLELAGREYFTAKDFERVLVTPMVDTDTKTAILDQVLDTMEIIEPARRFFHVVQRHYRMEHMRDIADTYRELVDRDLGRTRARIELATAVRRRMQIRAVPPSGTGPCPVSPVGSTR